jgi:hypothetical protein
MESTNRSGLQNPNPALFFDVTGWTVVLARGL